MTADLYRNQIGVNQFNPCHLCSIKKLLAFKPVTKSRGEMQETHGESLTGFQQLLRMLLRTFFSSADLGVKQVTQSHEQN